MYLLKNWKLSIYGEENLPASWCNRLTDRTQGGHARSVTDMLKSFLFVLKDRAASTWALVRSLQNSDISDRSVWCIAMKDLHLNAFYRVPASTSSQRRHKTKANGACQQLQPLSAGRIDMNMMHHYNRPDRCLGVPPDNELWHNVKW